MSYEVFGTAPLQAWHFLLSISFALVILIGDEIRRVYIRTDLVLAMEDLLSGRFIPKTRAKSSFQRLPDSSERPNSLFYAE